MRVAKQQKQTIDSTPMAVAIAALIGATALYCTEIIYSNIKDSGAPDMRQLPEWRVHMASACVGSLAFVIALFLLESLGRKSWRIALRSALPWLPMVVFTGFATGIHIPSDVTILVTAVYSPWAYLRTRAVH